MELKNSSVVVLFVLLTAAVNCVAQTKFESTLANTARKCQSTLKICLQVSARFKAAHDSRRYCDIFKINETEAFKEVLSFHCLVSIGLCTEDEFDDLAEAACGEVLSYFGVSEYEKDFYAAIDATSLSCQNQILYCIFNSAVATVLKQEREYCRIFYLSINGITSASCLGDKCSLAELALLKVAACDIEDDDYEEEYEEGLSDVLLMTSEKCQGAFENCTVLLHLRNKDYCQALGPSDRSTVVKTCMVTANGCSQKEFTFLQGEACEKDNALKFVSDMCAFSIMHCVQLSPIAYYMFRYGDSCDLFDITINDVSAEQCLTEIGFCTQLDFTWLELAYCDDYKTEMAVGELLLYSAIEESRPTCKNSVMGCIMGSIIATLLKADNQFCDLMKLSTNGVSADKCLTGCTEEDKSWFHLTSCNTSLAYIQPSPFTKAVMSTSQKCKDTIEKCSFGSDLAFASIQSKQYCKIMNIYQSGAETYACLVGNGGCTLSEYQAMTDAACENE